jgi:hypothetical protein
MSFDLDSTFTVAAGDPLMTVVVRKSLTRTETNFVFCIGGDNVLVALLSAGLYVVSLASVIYPKFNTEIISEDRLAFPSAQER